MGAKLTQQQVAWWSAQLLHVLLAVLVLVLVTELLPGNVGAVFAAVSGILGWAVFKEYYVDLRYEEGEDWISSTEDFAAYFLGTLLGLGVSYAVAAFLHRPF